ncbi:MAG: universal stress protein [Gammaproteobacteria bacterium]
MLRYAKRRKADLIVLGTRGLGQVKGMLMGSVSRKVTNLSDISCLIIR